MKPCLSNRTRSDSIRPMTLDESVTPFVDGLSYKDLRLIPNNLVEFLTGQLSLAALLMVLVRSERLPLQVGVPSIGHEIQAHWLAGVRVLEICGRPRSSEHREGGIDA